MKISFRRLLPKSHTTSGTLRNSFDRRTLVVGSVQGGLGMLLAARMGYLAVFENEKYKLEAESNRVNLSLIPPRRGWILDRHGTPLASNQADFRVDAIPARMTNVAQEINAVEKLLQLDPVQRQDLGDKIDKARGFAAVEVASGLDWERFAAVSVRLPDLPGIVTQRGFSRYYPNGPSVAHLIGYVGPASAEEYQKDHDPLLITPGYKVGKDGLEKVFEKELRGSPGARRVEVTASGRIVRELETREDTPGKAVKLTIDGGLQDYASRRIGLQSAAVVVIDCLTGGVLALCSMPAFDPNSFADGIGRLEWKMLNEDDHIPLLNKALRGLYPPGSTVKPLATLALQQHGISPDERVFCPGGYRLGRRYFRCDAVHGSMDMRSAIERSCNTYFWSMVDRVGYDTIAPVAKLLGLGQEFDLPVAQQRYGTVPDSTWKMRRYDQQWTAADSLNASIGQGYVSVSPFQLAVMTSRIASGRNLQPSLLYGQPKPLGPELPFTPEQLAVAHDGMFRVVNGAGTGRGSRIDIDGVLMAGKTGTAQVRRMISRGHVADWGSRDHSLFICYAPTDAPRYAMSVVVEHGGFGATSAAPIAKDVMTYLFNPGKAWDTLLALEKGWGGTAQERLDARYRQYVAQYGVGAPKVSAEKEIQKAREAENAQPAANEAQAPPEPESAQDTAGGQPAGAAPPDSNSQAESNSSGGTP
ncbi:penicillin-binding protein 2 [Novosphingobium beihaiensis]|uniref:Penicillin-binding protein 2 n=1 Tax=Novosphingobium beihaiensis TaxID=2930389 RepID=A0ABT0BMZ1_9SPHN|nr:penicillin-binding protein 2 [Novosphingobium beihaiensis]MCJ2186414.1 penicillin-binding protein 2 [Novosphingobium beihaiensis]